MTYACILLPYPPSLNSNWRQGKGGVHLSRAYREWRRAAGYTLIDQKPPHVSPPYVVEIAAARPDKRKRDLDNLIKPVLDLLTSNNVISDDSMVEHLTIYWATGDEVQNGVRVGVWSA